MERWSLEPSTRSVALSVLRYGPISRADIARRLGLSSGSLTRITKPLLEWGVVEQGEPVSTEVGRPSLPLRIVDHAGYFLGVKIVPGRAYCVTSGLSAKANTCWQIPIDTSSLESAAHAIAEIAQPLGRLDGIGIALPASVADSGELFATRMLGWRDGGNLAGRVAVLAKTRCSAINDIDGLTLFQHWFGAGRGVENFCVVTFGEGVGAGAVVDDRILNGHQGAASIIGRLWDRKGRTFGDVLSIAAVELRASQLAQTQLSFIEALTSDLASDVINDTRHILGQFVRTVAVAFAPERILLTGEGISLLGQSLEVIQEELEADWREDLALPELCLQDLDFYEYARGAVTDAIRSSLSR